MVTVCSPKAHGLDAIAVECDMRNGDTAVQRFDCAISGLLMTDAGSVFALYVAFSVRAEKAKDSHLKALYEPIAVRYLERFQELLRGRKIDGCFKEPIEVLKKKFLAIYPLER